MSGSLHQLRLTDDGSPTLYHEGYAQTFHSCHGALTESVHVFVEGTGVADRLAVGGLTRVLEVGFGTGLNLLATAARLPDSAELHFISFERAPLSADTLRQLGLERIEGIRAEDVEGLIDAAERGVTRFSLRPNLHVRLITGDAAEVVTRLSWARSTVDELHAEGLHAIYHDAFSPDSNPELWSLAFLSAIVQHLAPGGVLGTYTVQGETRRRLAELGLQVERVPGPPGGKRQCLRAVRPSAPT